MHNKVIETENKLLLDQQANYKELCRLLTDRHVEILGYLNYLNSIIEKFFSTPGKHNSMYAGFVNNKTQRESSIRTYDKQILELTQLIQTSHSRIADIDKNKLKEQMKLLSYSLKLPGQLTLNNFDSKSSCYECTDEFNSDQLIESHIARGHDNNNVNHSLIPALDPGVLVGSYGQQNDDDSDVRQMLCTQKLEVLEVVEAQLSQVGGNNDQNLELLDVKSNDMKNVKKTPQKKCQECGKFFDKHYIESHKRIHTGDKPFKCPVNGCERTFTQSSSRNLHVKRFHGELNLYVNEVMLEDSQQQLHVVSLISTPQNEQHESSVVNQHGLQINQHNNNNVTNGTKTRSRSISRRTQTSQKYSCAQCGKGFAYKVALKQHELMHGPKNFQCDYPACDYASHWKHNLQLHKNKHHPVKQEQLVHVHMPSVNSV